MSSDYTPIQLATILYERNRKFQKQFFYPFVERHPRLKAANWEIIETRPPGVIEQREIRENVLENTYRTNGWIEFAIVFDTDSIANNLTFTEYTHLSYKENDMMYGLLLKRMIVESNNWLEEFSKYYHRVEYDSQQYTLNLIYRINVEGKLEDFIEEDFPF